jgi:hypothetical protein
MRQFHKFFLSWNSTCFGQFVCPSSGVYSLYTQQLYMSYRLVDGFRAGSGILPFLGGERKVNSEYVSFCYIFPHSSPLVLYEILRICFSFYNWKIPLSFIHYTVKKHSSFICSPLFLHLVGYDMYLRPLCFAVSCVAERNCIDNNLISTYCISYYGLFYFTHLLINPPIPVAERFKA